MQRISVGDIMTRNFSSVYPEEDLLSCSKKMVKEDVNSLIIKKENKLVGIITAKDILWAITKKPNLNLKEVKALEISTKKIAVIKPSADINQALQKMKEYNFRRLPVLSNGEIIGVITLKDILRIDPSLYSETGELVKIREEEIKLKQKNAEWSSEGLCDNCGAFSELLKVDNRLICPDCREEMY